MEVLFIIHKNKRFPALFLALVLLCSNLMQAFAFSGFQDIQDHWAKEYIERTTQKGWFSGASKTTFAPDAVMTRGMFVKVLAQYSDETIDEKKTKTDFIDVSPKQWYAAEVRWAVERGIVSGTSSTTFSPDAPVTREQLAVMLINFVNAKGVILPRVRKWKSFADVKQCSDYALDAIYTLYCADVVNGTSKNQFQPKKAVTRAQCAVMLCKLFEACHQLSDPSVQIPLISHSGYNIEAGENTLRAFELAAQYEYQYVEADVRFTSDNIPVLIHDATIDRTSNGKGKVSEMTYQQLQKYNFSNGFWWNRGKITSYETFIEYCSQIGFTAYVELKNAITEEQADILLNIAKKYGMQDRIIWISYSTAALKQIRAVQAYAPLSLICNEVTAKEISKANALKNGINSVSVCALYTKLTTAQRAKLIRASLPLIVWPVDNLKECVRYANSSASAITTNKIIQQKLYPHS